MNTDPFVKELNEQFISFERIITALDKLPKDKTIYNIVQKDIRKILNRFERTKK